jgi:hypothetical protein
MKPPKSACKVIFTLQTAIEPKVRATVNKLRSCHCEAWRTQRFALAPKQSRRAYFSLDCFARQLPHARNDGIERESDGNKARLSSCADATRVIARSEATKQSRRAFASLDCFARQLPRARNDGIEREFDGNKAHPSSGPGAVRVIARRVAPKQSRRAFASLDCFAALAMTVLNVSSTETKRIRHPAPAQSVSLRGA